MYGRHGHQRQNTSPQLQHRGYLDLALTAADRYAYSLLPAALQGTSLSSPGPSSSFPNPKDVTHQGQHAARSLHERGQARGIANHQPPHASLEASTLLQQSSTHFGQPATQSRSHEQPYYAPDAGLIQQRSAAVASSWDSGLRDILSSLEPSDRAVKPVKLKDHRHPQSPAHFSHGGGLRSKLHMQGFSGEASEDFRGSTMHYGSGKVQYKRSHVANMLESMPAPRGRQGQLPALRNDTVQEGLSWNDSRPQMPLRQAWLSTPNQASQQASLSSSAFPLTVHYSSSHMHDDPRASTNMTARIPPKKFTSSPIFKAGALQQQHTLMSPPALGPSPGSNAAHHADPASIAAQFPMLSQFKSGFANMGGMSMPGGFRGSTYMPPAYQQIAAAQANGGMGGAPGSGLGFMTGTVVIAAPGSSPGLKRQYPPFMSSAVSTLAKPLTVQYSPVLKSPPKSMIGISTMAPPIPPPQLSPVSHLPPAVPQYRPPGTPSTEVAVQQARERHAQTLDRVIQTVQDDMYAPQPATPEHAHSKSMFMHLYEANPGAGTQPLSPLSPHLTLSQAQGGAAAAAVGQYGVSSELQGAASPAHGQGFLPDGEVICPLQQSPGYLAHAPSVSAAGMGDLSEPPSRSPSPRAFNPTAQTAEASAVAAAAVRNSPLPSGTPPLQLAPLSTMPQAIASPGSRAGTPGSMRTPMYERRLDSRRGANPPGTASGTGMRNGTAGAAALAAAGAALVGTLAPQECLEHRALHDEICGSEDEPEAGVDAAGARSSCSDVMGTPHALENEEAGLGEGLAIGDGEALAAVEEGVEPSDSSAGLNDASVNTGEKITPRSDASVALHAAGSVVQGGADDVAVEIAAAEENDQASVAAANASSEADTAEAGEGEPRMSGQGQAEAAAGHAAGAEADAAAGVMSASAEDMQHLHGEMSMAVFVTEQTSGHADEAACDSEVQLGSQPDAASSSAQAAPEGVKGPAQGAEEEGQQAEIEATGAVVNVVLTPLEMEVKETQSDTVADLAPQQEDEQAGDQELPILVQSQPTTALQATEESPDEAAMSQAAEGEPVNNAESQEYHQAAPQEAEESVPEGLRAAEALDTMAVNDSVRDSLPQSSLHHVAPEADAAADDALTSAAAGIVYESADSMLERASPMEEDEEQPSAPLQPLPEDAVEPSEASEASLDAEAAAAAAQAQAVAVAAAAAEAAAQRAAEEEASRQAAAAERAARHAAAEASAQKASEEASALQAAASAHAAEDAQAEADARAQVATAAAEMAGRELPVGMPTSVPELEGVEALVHALDESELEPGATAAAAHSDARSASAATAVANSATAHASERTTLTSDPSMQNVLNAIQDAGALPHSTRMSTAEGGQPLSPAQMDVLMPSGCRLLNGKYEVQHVVGEGAYGIVMKCSVLGSHPPEHVAIKEFKISDDDPDAEEVKRTSRREVDVLRGLAHPHVVRCVESFTIRDRLFIVMEFLPCNLLELLDAQPGGMDKEAVRLILFQLCSAIAFIHGQGMVYRDIKPENLLVDERGTVKLCDFGFARSMTDAHKHLTDYVATRWYRAPELLLGPPYHDDATKRYIQYMYGPPIDMWAIGCLMGELTDGEPLFAGDSDLDQLYRIQQVLGPMTAEQETLFRANPHNAGIVFNIKQPLTLSERYAGKMGEVELDFLAGLLEMDPGKRLTGDACLQHRYLEDLYKASLGAPTPPSSYAGSTLDGRNSAGAEGPSVQQQAALSAVKSVSQLPVVDSEEDEEALREDGEAVREDDGPSDSEERLTAQAVQK